MSGVLTDQRDNRLTGNTVTFTLQAILWRHSDPAGSRPGHAIGTHDLSLTGLCCVADGASQHVRIVTNILLAGLAGKGRVLSGVDRRKGAAGICISSTKIVDPFWLERFVNGSPRSRQSFALSLAMACFETLLHHNSSRALTCLRDASNQMQLFLGRKPSMEYQYAEAAETLYCSTGNYRFGKLAAACARLIEHIQPWTACPYAIEAELTTNPHARSQSLVNGSALDPLSLRSEALPAAEVAHAGSLLRARNRFVKARTPLSSDCWPEWWAKRLTAGGSRRRRACG